LAGACATVVDPPLIGDRVPLVEAVLVGGDTAATFRLGWVDPVAGLSALAAEPIAPDAVALWLSGPTGPPVSLAPTDSAAWYLALIPLVAGTSYSLSGTIDGRSIAASTTLPANFIIDSPEELIDVGRSGRVMPFRWRADGATVYLADHGVFGESQFHHTRDTVGSIQITAPPTTRRLTLWALNSDGERYLYQRTSPRGNVTGALGVMAGALRAARDFAWR
jgi:hypothetical protein